jgi:hypothetical protein
VEAHALRVEEVKRSRERRAQQQLSQQAALADLMVERFAPVVVQGVESLLSDKFNQPLVAPVAGRVGYQDLLRPASPAAGANFTYTVSGDKVLWPLSVMARLTTSAVAGDRTLALEYQDSDGVRYLVAGAPVVVSNSDTRSWVWHPNAGETSWPVEDAVISPLPQQHLYATNRLVLRIGGADGGDQLDQVRISAWVYPT